MRKQCGSTIVEFALVLIIFLTFFLGILDFSRMLWTWNSANEATRWGARSAVVCDRNAAVVLTNMQKFVPQLKAANVTIDWYDGTGAISTSCGPTNCAGVNIQIVNLNYRWISPIGFGSQTLIPMPGFSTYLPREAMGQDLNSTAVCS